MAGASLVFGWYRLSRDGLTSCGVEPLGDVIKVAREEGSVVVKRFRCGSMSKQASAPTAYVSLTVKAGHNVT